MTPAGLNPRSATSFVAASFLASYFCLPLAVSAAERKATAASDPHWEGFRNRLLPATTRLTHQDFGLQGANRIGGWIQRSTTPAWFGRVISTRTLEDELEASGKFAVTKAGGSSGVLFGWFNQTSHGWCTPNSLAFRLDGNGGKYWVFVEYGTRHWLTGGVGCFEGPRYQTTPTRPFPADGTVHEWSLRYRPHAAGGQGEIHFVLDGKEYICPLAPGHKADGAFFNRFGVFNVQTPGNGMEVSFSDRNGGHCLPKAGPIIRPDAQVHSWAIHYEPRAADDRGQVTVTFDGHNQTLTLTAKQHAAGAVFDRFGLFNLQTGGQDVELSLADLTYTSG